ncbi:MAG TPA: HD domain-containing phosphohydrolase [Geobacteraceae bacterium]|nr:HD domain-containing phosphohydrolase [Geobacteraceae bacterium]
MAINIDMRQVVLLIASAVDLVGVDDVLHGRRVAILAVECAKQLGWDQATQHLLFDAGLLHDLGVSSTRVHRTIVNEFDWEGAEHHCEQGCRLLQGFSPLAKLAPLVRYHHTHWDELQKGDIDPSVALYANLIYLADRVDVSATPYYADNSLLLRVQDICAMVNRHRGTLFAPELVDAFLEAAQVEAFWLILNSDFIPQYIIDTEQHGHREHVGLADLRKFALIIAEIVDAKSHFTTEHSLGVARLARFIAGHFGLHGSRLDLLEVAALLHDIGKLQIPDEVLESPHKLTPLERAIIKKHSFATYQILKRVSGLEELARWASQHHESLNGGGYPFHLVAGELPLEARIIKVADIYQALAQNRPYRQPLPPLEILSHLRQMQADLEVDPILIDFVAQHLDSCHGAAVGQPAV